MRTKVKMLLITSHLVIFVIGVGLGVYLLPILTAQENATLSEITNVQKQAKYEGKFVPNQQGSDPLHWVEGELFVTDNEIAFKGKVAPGPDYKIYLTKKQAVDKNSFLEMKKEAVLIGELKNFGNFKKNIPESVNVNDFTTVQIWCERFSQFIGSAKYKNDA
ncbi:DM13 domain-containing protein [Acinetobacter sp. neg1]|uniref:DM13 domain-containing protein n=1 Tax=Acinetobacter sp. neg1 TaxID=1561068 RepID=UPI000645AAB1|nr:DM13 domain-containing protein [Acinetobacter sp. neg1]